MKKQNALIASIFALMFASLLLLVAPSIINDLGAWWRQQASSKLAMDDPTNLYETAERYYRAGDLEMAHDVANRAVIVDPKFVQGHKLLAAIYMKQKNFAKAEETCRAAAKLAPDDNNIQLALGMALKNQGRTAEAEKVYLDVIKRKDADDFHKNEVLNQLESMQPGRQASPSAAPSPKVGATK